MRILAAAIFVICLLWFPQARAAGDDGAATGCEPSALQWGWSMANGRQVFSDADVRAVAFQIDTPVYTAPTGNTRGPRALKFSEHVIIADPGEPGGRLRIKDIGGQPLGWVNRNDVLCRRLPLSDAETGLYRRAVVRTAPDVQGTPQEKPVYQSLDKRCEGGANACVKVSRFTWYFVYAEMKNGDQTYYLISEAANLGSSVQRLLGWLPAQDAINWNTALGLRPSEKLPDDKYVCAYETLSDLRSRTGCKEAIGGMRWFTLDARMSVIKDNTAERYYQVAFSNAFGNPEKFGRDVASLLDPFKRVDVFFVIDGTKSMQPAIDGAKRIVKSLQQKTTGKVTAREGTIRFGFRIYRDSVAGKKDGVENSEHLSLSTSCDVPNEKEFERAFQNVKAYEPGDDDDYPENVFGGLIQASVDMATCPDNTKVVFVIGDHGYDAVKQRARGFKSYTTADVAKAFKRGTIFHTQPLVFFIQTPSDSGNPNIVAPTAKVNYDAAYELFNKQGKEIVKQIYEGSGIDIGINTAFIQLMPGSISDGVVARTTDKVNDWMRPEALQFIADETRRGESLHQVIDRLRGNNPLNIPIRYLQFVERSLCDRVGSRCDETVFETVNLALLNREDVLVPEVLLTAPQLQKWLDILSKFTRAMDDLAASDVVRNLIVNALLKDLGDILQLIIPNSREELGKFIQFQRGIPHAANSKLMRYSPEELMDSRKVPPCEIDRLVHYASRKHAILKMILEGSGRIIPDYQEDRWQSTSCPNLSEKGKDIPEIKGDIKPVRLNPPEGGTNYTFLRTIGGSSFYWVPVRYLP
jgi:hypothetical protein